MRNIMNEQLTEFLPLNMSKITELASIIRQLPKEMTTEYWLWLGQFADVADKVDSIEMMVEHLLGGAHSLNDSLAWSAFVCGYELQRQAYDDAQTAKYFSELEVKGILPHAARSTQKSFPVLDRMALSRGGPSADDDVLEETKAEVA
jgi:hypothetical protein